MQTYKILCLLILAIIIFTILINFKDLNISFAKNSNTKSTIVIESNYLQIISSKDIFGTIFGGVLGAIVTGSVAIYTLNKQLKAQDESIEKQLKAQDESIEKKAEKVIQQNQYKRQQEFITNKKDLYSNFIVYLSKMLSNPEFLRSEDPNFISETIKSLDDELKRGNFSLLGPEALPKWILLRAGFKQKYSLLWHTNENEKKIEMWKNVEDLITVMETEFNNEIIPKYHEMTGISIGKMNIPLPYDSLEFFK
jgi:hypothetical protein